MLGEAVCSENYLRTLLILQEFFKNSAVVCFFDQKSHQKILKNNLDNIIISCLLIQRKADCSGILQVFQCSMVCATSILVMGGRNSRHNGADYRNGVCTYCGGNEFFNNSDFGIPLMKAAGFTFWQHEEIGSIVNIAKSSVLHPKRIFVFFERCPYQEVIKGRQKRLWSKFFENMLKLKGYKEF